MSCGLEGLVLALKLATELVDKPYTPFVPYVTCLAIPGGCGGQDSFQPEWSRLRQQAAAAEARDAKLKEFQQMSRMCLMETSSGTEFDKHTAKTTWGPAPPPGTYWDKDGNLKSSR